MRGPHPHPLPRARERGARALVGKRTWERDAGYLLLARVGGFRGQRPSRRGFNRWPPQLALLTHEIDIGVFQARLDGRHLSVSGGSLWLPFAHHAVLHLRAQVLCGNDR